MPETDTTPDDTANVYSDLSPDDPFVFAACKWTVDDQGCLHVFRRVDGTTTMLGAFAAGTWAVHAGRKVVS